MDINLDPIEARVLGCLAEKELATPEYYPLTLNALTNACNQKSNRDPVMALEEAQVQGALDSLRKMQLAMTSSEGVRTTRYAHNLRGVLHLHHEEVALMTVLLLRGPQTVGELRTRAERMHPFADLAAVSSVLEELSDRTPPLIVQLPRQPGRKESRYAQLLTPAPEQDDAVAAPGDAPAPAAPPAQDLKSEIEQLRSEVEDLRRELEEFKSQFE